MTITVTKDDPDTDTLTVEFSLNSFEQQDRFPVDALGFFPGYEDVESWQPLDFTGDGGQTWFTYVSAQ